MEADDKTNDVRSASGAVRLYRDRATRTVYSTDNSIYQLTPESVGLPESRDQIAEQLRRNLTRARPKPIVARGGGTGTNGQSLTTGTMLDLKRHLNQIVSLDVEARTVTVQPGIVTAELNASLADHGLFWPPHTSTLNRATVGGMISTDAAGKGSLVYGRTHRHVTRLVVLLDDGTEFIAEPVREAEAARRAGVGGRAGSLWSSLLDLALGDSAALGLPELARGFSGYGIDRFRVDGIVDPIALICGAEGTLGIIVEATLALSPVPTSPRLIVASYPSFADALDDAVDLRGTGPSAIECFDETTLERGRSSPAWSALGVAIGEHDVAPDGGGDAQHGVGSADANAVLLLEYTGAAATDIDNITATIGATGRSLAIAVVDDSAGQSSIWKVRADAVGLLAKVATGGPDRSARPTAFVEDCAVPVAHMSAFISGFRQILDEAGLTYGMFGHADVGCVHVRPALDLTDPDQRTLVASITDQVIDLVRSHGGLVWGEHGRGFRGAHAATVLPERTHALMREVKAAFDPHNIFNPGKLYTPAGDDTTVLGVADVPMRGEIDAAVPVEIRRDFSHAFACNGNGLCNQYSSDEVMCPSFTVTGDPSMSPKGRVDLMRAWLADRGVDDGFESQIAANLRQCLSCSACSGRCPVEVDIPELKSQFFEQYYDGRRRPLSHHVMSRFEQLAGLATRAPRLFTAGRAIAEPMLGLADLPAVPARVRIGAPTFDGSPGPDIVVMVDVFTSVLDPETLQHSLAVLDSLGYATAVSRRIPSGKFDHVYGRRARFAKAAARQAAEVEAIVAAGATPVVIEPAVALLHGHEYVAHHPGYPSAAVRTLASVVAERSHLLSPVADPRAVWLFGHCTERATAPAAARQWIEVLESVGYRVDAPEVGCCGMAGFFGHEATNAAMSAELWDRSWGRRLEELRDDPERYGAAVVVAPGYSCRSQAKRLEGASLRHPIHLVNSSN